MTNYFIFAGEPSGDLHGSGLMRAIKNQNPVSYFTGVGGPLMREEKLHIILEMENFRVMGFTDVFKALPKLYKQFYIVKNAILDQQPAVVILIDYPGFNLRLAKSLRKSGFKGKIVQYICPTVWAHGKKRIDTMTKYLDLLLTIFPFEAAFFAHSSLKVRYIGNPLVETIAHHVYKAHWKEQLKIPDNKDLIAIFPGSRPSEIAKQGPLLLNAAKEFKINNPSTLFAVSYADEEFYQSIKKLLAESTLKLDEDIFLVPHQFRYELMKGCKAALAKSGTVTLELALHRKPTVVVYNLSKLNYYIAKYFLRLRLPYYCIVNIILQKEIFPEYIGEKLNASYVAGKLETIVSSHHYSKIVADCEVVKNRLGRMPTSQTAAKAIEELLKY